MLLNEFDYRYGCEPDRPAVIMGKGFEETARSMRKFETAERRGQDVNVVIFDKEYTFDVAGFKNAAKVVEAGYRNL